MSRGVDGGEKAFPREYLRSRAIDPGRALPPFAESAGVGVRGWTPVELCTDPVETEKKILRNVFVAGDIWFCTGDLTQADQHGYYFFVDRVGNTFRWRGENVATCETGSG